MKANTSTSFAALPQESWIGGRIHHVIHLRCAAKMKCDRIYTFNLRDFRAIAPMELADKISAP